MKRGIDISGWPVMTTRCASCPFNPDGDHELRRRVEERLVSASQVCHHPRLHGKTESHLCRGARDVQIQIMHRLGYIDTPDDAGWRHAATGRQEPNTMTQTDNSASETTHNESPTSDTTQYTLTATDETGALIKLKPISLSDATALALEIDSHEHLQWLTESLLKINPNLTNVSFNLSSENEIDDEGNHFTSWFAQIDDDQLADAVSKLSDNQNEVRVRANLELFFGELGNNTPSAVLNHWFENHDESGVITLDLPGILNQPIATARLYIAVND